MNKTLNTIAWICLALGLLGILMDAGALIFGRRLATDRQAAIAEMRASAAKGNTPSEGNRCIAEDTNKDGKPDSDCLQLQQPGWPGDGQPGFGGQPGRGRMMVNFRDRFDGGRFGQRGILPLFFMTLGPILAVIGAVILLVNREPKNAVMKEEKEVKEEKKKEVKK